MHGCQIKGTKEHKYWFILASTENLVLILAFFCVSIVYKLCIFFSCSSYIEKKPKSEIFNEKCLS